MTDPAVRIARRRAKRRVVIAELRAEADHLERVAAAATALAGRSREAARQKRLTADQLAGHAIDIDTARSAEA